VLVDRADLLRELHGQHARALWGFALSLTAGDRARAEDVVQETLMRAWQSPTVFEVPAAARRAWLFTVARNLVIDQWRSARSRRETPVATPPEAPVVDQTDAVVQSWLVADALARLSPDHRRVLVECYYRGRPVAEAARVLGVPEGTVKSRVHYALRALRLVLEEMGVTS
jgi:RNA polymerase sigma-70 factor (ECF subfamily)